jgi:hypothetical protein
MRCSMFKKELGPGKMDNLFQIRMQTFGDGTGASRVLIYFFFFIRKRTRRHAQINVNLTDAPWLCKHDFGYIGNCASNGRHVVFLTCNSHDREQAICQGGSDQVGR